MNDASVSPEKEYKAGFAMFLGRPNVGKSTLINTLVGEPVAITSNKPQTTRKAIRAILTAQMGQLILVDSPGVHRPRTLLGERLNDLVYAYLSDVDVLAVCFAAHQKVGPGDRFICEQVAKNQKAKKIAIVTQTDRVSTQSLLKQLKAVGEVYQWDEIVPVSAQTGVNCDLLTEILFAALPEALGPLYDEDTVTDQSVSERIAEYIRQAALEGARQELPHSIAVTLEDIDQSSDSVTRIYANIVLERESQKKIIIGTGGSNLKTIGIQAREQIENLLGKKVYLSLHVKVEKEWQKNPKTIHKLGF